MEKNAKRLKKVSDEKIPLPHISAIGALYNIICTDSGSYSAELQLFFSLAIFGNWSCDQYSNIPLNEP